MLWSRVFVRQALIDVFVYLLVLVCLYNYLDLQTNLLI